ncbi:hypothetical protein [Halococcus agarilyticus]|uniref:hypothetical protein n=1 Tax=Halococcus agarilyticus TaxID=1232219 RepID=UPI0012ABAE58|nr:hypothetical protein [Halococcus agarilyticus]
MRGEDEGQMDWTVATASDGKRTVTFHYERGAEAFDTTLTGTQESIETELITTPARPFLSIVLFPSVQLLIGDGEPRVGDRHTFPVAGREGTLEITGTGTHLGIEGYTSVWKVDGERRYEDCVALDLGLVLSATYYSSGDTAAFLQAELVKYERD